jgi:hypothetical protein
MQHFGYLTDLQPKDPLFKLLGQLTPLETPNCPSLRRRWPLGVCSSEIGKGITHLYSLSQSLRFMSRFGDPFWPIRLWGAADQDLAKTSLIGLANRERIVVTRVRLWRLW